MLMLDIETLGLTPGSLIPTIGWCVFTWEGIVDRGTFSIDIEKMPGKLDVSTVKFWLQQDPEAIAKTFFRDDTPLPWPIALAELAKLVKLPETQADQGVWGNGVLFDLGHLEFWYAQAQAKVPWHYRSPRDMRTYCAVVAEMTGWDQAVATQYLQEQHASTLTKHDAEDDAVLQALVLIDAHEAMRALRDRAARYASDDAAKVQYPRDAIDAG